MNKHHIKIILIETPNAQLVIENHLKKLLPNVTFEIEDLSGASFEQVPRKQIGYEYVAYSESILENQLQPENSLIITKHPLSSGARINLLPNQSRFFGSSILTLKNLNESIYLKDAAPLIYYTIIQFLSGNLDASEHEPRCIGNAQQGYEHTPSLKTCSACQFLSNERKGYYEDIMARVYSNIEKNPKNHIVVLTHGIRTNGSWMYRVRDKLEFNGYSVRVSGYNRFSVAGLIGYSFGGTGKKVRELLKRDINDAKLDEPYSKITVIAHSQGTLLLSDLLESNDVQIDRAILVGSIVRRDFPWKDVIERGSIKKVLNDVRCRDIWACIAENWIKGAGGSGADGFQKESSNVRSVFSKYKGHGASLKNTIHQEKLWMPFLECGDYAVSSLNDDEYRTSNESKVKKFFMDIFRIKYVIAFGVTSFIFAIYHLK